MARVTIKQIPWESTRFTVSLANGMTTVRGALPGSEVYLVKRTGRPVATICKHNGQVCFRSSHADLAFPTLTAHIRQAAALLGREATVEDAKTYAREFYSRPW